MPSPLRDASAPKIKRRSSLTIVPFHSPWRRSLINDVSARYPAAPTLNNILSGEFFRQLTNAFFNLLRESQKIGSGQMPTANTVTKKLRNSKVRRREAIPHY